MVDDALFHNESEYILEQLKRLRADSERVGNSKEDTIKIMNNYLNAIKYPLKVTDYSDNGITGSIVLESK
jgi:hypothetical protein